MGNIENKEKLPDKGNFHVLDYGYCRVWKRKLDSKQIMEEYPVNIESEERLKLYQNIWPLRTNHSIFVNVYHFSHSQTSNFCSGTAKGSIFTQRIPHRLCEFSNIKYPDILKIMKTCIQGYKILYQNFGAFIVRSTMIGFTQNFHIKLWLHTDFSEPQPENPYCKRLQDMFASLINAVESTEQYLYYNCPKFSQFLVQTNYVYLSKDFDFLLKGLEDYAQKLGLKMPNDLSNLKNCFRQPEGWQKFKAKNNYPVLLPSQKSISSSSYTTSHQTIESKKQIEIKPNQQKTASTSLKRSQSNKSLIKGTNNRVISPKIQFNQRPQPRQSQNYHQFQRLKTVQADYIRNSNTNQPPKFWRSSERLSTDQSQKITNSHQVKRQSQKFNVPQYHMNLNNPSNEYFGQIHDFQKQKRYSQTVNQKFPRKSFDLSTDTQNREKSIKSEFSLIQDLESHSKIPPQNRGFYNS